MKIRKTSYKFSLTLESDNLIALKAIKTDHVNI